MRTLGILLLACLLTVPVVASAPAADRFYGDVETTRGVAFVTSCRDVAPATLHLVHDQVPESGRVHLQVDTACGSPRFAARAQLEADGWRLGDGERVRGWLRPVDDTAETWSFWLEVSTCPPDAICEFTLAWMRYEGTLQRPDVIHH